MSQRYGKFEEWLEDHYSSELEGVSGLETRTRKQGEEPVLVLEEPIDLDYFEKAMHDAGYLTHRNGLEGNDFVSVWKEDGEGSKSSYGGAFEESREIPFGISESIANSQGELVTESIDQTMDVVITYLDSLYHDDEFPPEEL